jgi:hypothetical protein
LLKKWDIPMWYPWGNREVDLVKSFIETRSKSDPFFVPTQDELDAPVVLNRHRGVPPSISTYQNRPPCSMEVTCRPPPTPIRAGTPPASNSHQRPGQTWQAFFKEMDAQNTDRIKTETSKQRQAREARQRQPATKNASFYEWRKNSAGDWICHHVDSGEGLRLYEQAEDGEC